MNVYTVIYIAVYYSVFYAPLPSHLARSNVIFGLAIALFFLYLLFASCIRDCFQCFRTQEEIFGS